MTTKQDKFIMKLRKRPCCMCGTVDKKGNHIIGYDSTNVDGVLNDYYKVGDTLCADCLFK